MEQAHGILSHRSGKWQTRTDGMMSWMEGERGMMVMWKGHQGIHLTRTKRKKNEGCIYYTGCTTVKNPGLFL